MKKITTIVTLLCLNLLSFAQNKPFQPAGIMTTLLVKMAVGQFFKTVPNHF